MVDRVLTTYLERQCEAATVLAGESDILEVRALDGPAPQHYIATFHAKGLVRSPSGDIVGADRFDVGIRLPEDYLRRVNPAEVLTCLGPLNAWHPNIRHMAICLHLTPGMPLVDLLYALFELWTYHLYNTGDEGLNRAASQWLRSQPPGRFPTDRRPLKRRELDIRVTEDRKEGQPSC